MPLTILQSVLEVGFKTKIIRVTSIAKKDLHFPVSTATWKISFLHYYLMENVILSSFYVCFCTINMMISTCSFTLWVRFSCWTCVDEWSFLMSYHIMAQGASVHDLVVVAVCTQEICSPTYSFTSFHWHLFYQFQFCIEMIFSLIH